MNRLITERRALALKVQSAAAAFGGWSELAAWVGVPRTVAIEWGAGEVDLPPDAARAVIDLEFIISRARMHWDDSMLPNWLRGHNAFLDGASPLETVRRGRTSDVLDAIVGESATVYA